MRPAVETTPTATQTVRTERDGLRPQPLIACTSVSQSSAWYQRTLGLVSAHGGDEYEMLVAGDVLVLQLHEADVHEHPALLRAGEPLGGNGAALWFETAEFDAAVDRIRAAEREMDVVVVEDVHVNPLAHHREIWLRDPDGYVVVVSSPYGDTGG